jgi:3-dehydroquinate dehydratase II
MSARTFGIISGPNLNLLGEREPEVYGTLTLRDIEQRIAAYAATHGATVQCSQFNGEGAIIDELHRLRRVAHGIVLNPGAYTHYSIAIRDAISSIAIPVVEVHLSDIMAREPFRRVSVVAEVCIAQISGLGPDSYLRGIDALLAHLGAKTAR